MAKCCEPIFATTRLGNQLMGLLQSNPCQHLQHRHLRSCSQRISCQHLKGQQLIYPCCKKQSWQHKFLMMPLLLQSTVKRLPTCGLRKTLHNDGKECWMKHFVEREIEEALAALRVS